MLVSLKRLPPNFLPQRVASNKVGILGETKGVKAITSNGSSGSEEQAQQAGHRKMLRDLFAARDAWKRRGALWLGWQHVGDRVKDDWCPLVCLDSMKRASLEQPHPFGIPGC